MNAQAVQRWFKANGIQRLYMSEDGKTFSVSLYADEGSPIYATGTSLTEAFDDAADCREYRRAEAERLAA